jgi:two-component system, response regulator YesN
VLRLVLVDDEQIVIEGIAHILNKNENNFEIVGTANDGAEGIVLITKLVPDVVITDIRMPGLDGIDLLKTIKRSLPNVYFIMLSGFSEFEYAQNALRYGAYDYLLKPVDHSQLTKVLHSIETEIEQKNQRDCKKRDVELSLANFIKESERLNLLKVLFEDDVLSFPEIDIKKVRVAIIKTDENRGKIAEGIVEAHLKKLQHEIILEYIKYNQAWIIILDGKNTYEELKKAIYSIENHFHKCFFVGISRNHELNRGLKQAYHEASEAVEALVFNEKIDILFFENLLYKSGDKTQSINLPIKSQEMIIDKVISGQSEKLKEYLEQISKEIVMSGILYNPENFKNECRELLIYVNRLLKDEGIDFQSRDDVREGSEDIFEGLKNLREYFNFLKTALINIALYIEKSKNGVPKSIRVVIQYIDTHYYEEITLKQISDLVFLNQWYFSELFKEKIGVHFTDYLINLRIQKAKDLLKQMDLKTYQISEMVGFNDSAYFCNIFKKITGITPGDYRKTIR